MSRHMKLTSLCVTRPLLNIFNETQYVQPLERPVFLVHREPSATCSETDRQSARFFSCLDSRNFNGIHSHRILQDRNAHNYPNIIYKHLRTVYIKYISINLSTIHTSIYIFFHLIEHYPTINLFFHTFILISAHPSSRPVNNPLNLNIGQCTELAKSR
jgi:hypothetical protein